MKYQEIEGNLITLALEGRFDVVAHGCNCLCTMGAGIAPQMARAFGADKFPMEAPEYQGDMNKLGTIDYARLTLTNDGRVYPESEVDTDEVKGVLTVVNAYTQYDMGGPSPIDYEAVTLCMRKMNAMFAGERVGLPLIGCGLAGGVWTAVKAIIQNEMSDCDVIIVHFKP